MENKKTLSFGTILLVLVCLGVNIVGSRLALALGLPLFLDSVGTILSGALGGVLPGMLVGFFTNLINGLADPITLYYSILSIMIAVAAAHLAKKRAFLSLWKSLLTAFVFAAIGGGLGSCLTWLMYGFDFGTGISAPFAILLFDHAGLPKFWAQFIADMGIDFADKLITVLVVFVAIRYAPKKLLKSLPYGELYCPDADSVTGGRSRFYRRFSLRSKMIVVIVATAIVLGSLSTVISYALYRSSILEKYSAEATGVAELMRAKIDADSIPRYLETGSADHAYDTTEQELYEIKYSFSDIVYMYVYSIEEDGCRVVFDLDSGTVKGSELGSVVAFDEDFEPYIDTLKAGGMIDPVVSHGQYGWLLTVYEPVVDSTGKCVAYAAADIDMSGVRADQYIFIIRTTALLFGASIILLLFVIGFAERGIVEPINAMTAAAEHFAFDSDADRSKNAARLKQLKVKTGDEIESLHDALTKTVTDMAQYITDIKTQAQLISKMQSGIIMSFADLVESRDMNTGEHIKNTALYVRMIAERLRQDGKYSDILTDSYMDDLVRSAPLHDIGKIKISDVILNKPGRLTPDEFEVMKTHASEGRTILRAAANSIGVESYLAVAMDMAEYHHERFDGTGYPEGLSGSDIPLAARIMAVADVFDALISKRSYKEAMPFGEALQTIIDGSGTHFDPDIVDAFVKIADTLKETKSMGGEENG